MQKYSTPAIVPGGGKDALSIETLPDTLFGSVDVYLASEVDAKFKEYDDDNLALSQSVVKLGARIAELERALRKIVDTAAPTSHHANYCVVHRQLLGDASALMVR